MIHLREVKLQLGLKPLRRNLTHYVYSVTPVSGMNVKRRSIGYFQI